MSKLIIKKIWQITRSQLLSEIISYLVFHLLIRSIINTFGIKRVNSFDEWHRSHVDIAALNAEIRLNLTDDARSELLENNTINYKRNETKRN